MHDIEQFVVDGEVDDVYTTMTIDGYDDVKRLIVYIGPRASFKHKM